MDILTGVSTVFLVFGLVATVWGIKLFNKMIKLRTIVEEGWSGVMVALRRRRDLIPNLVQVAGIYVGHENDTLKGVAEARSLGQAAKSVAETARAESLMMGALAGFKGIVESYPELKADKNMMHVQEQLTELEERIEKVRRYYNATVRDHNMEMARFPANLITPMLGFKSATFFETDESVVEAPEIKFDRATA
jgi:LemA protein